LLLTAAKSAFSKLFVTGRLPSARSRNAASVGSYSPPAEAAHKHRDGSKYIYFRLNESEAKEDISRIESVNRKQVEFRRSAKAAIPVT
jgi:hypothetical protein